MWQELLDSASDQRDSRGSPAWEMRTTAVDRWSTPWGQLEASRQVSTASDARQGRRTVSWSRLADRPAQASGGGLYGWMGGVLSLESERGRGRVRGGSRWSSAGQDLADRVERASKTTSLTRRSDQPRYESRSCVERGAARPDRARLHLCVERCDAASGRRDSIANAVT